MWRHDVYETVKLVIYDAVSESAVLILKRREVFFNVRFGDGQLICDTHKLISSAETRTVFILVEFLVRVEVRIGET